MTTDFTRDRWGRPVIIPPGGGKPTAYGRFSSHGQILEDRFGLERWKVRVAGRGLTLRSDLYAQVAACPADDTSRLDELMQAALDAGGASVGAGIGTALHEFTARVEAGEIGLDDVPDPWRADVETYLATINAYGLSVVTDLVEVQLVNDVLQLAGTADRFLRRASDGRLVCADLKTGKKISANPLAYIVQLAAYANSMLYDIATGERREVGDVDLECGLIIHLPSGEARCELYEVDLIAGWEVAQVASEVKSWQKRKGLVQKISEVTHGSAPSVTAAVEHSSPGAPAADIRRDWVRDRIKSVVTHSPEAGAALATKWPVDVPTIRSGHPHSAEELDQIVALLTRIEAEYLVPFSEPDPTAPKPAKRKTKAAAASKAPSVIDEGALVDDSDLDALKSTIAGLSADQQALIGSWTSEAAAAGRTVSLRILASVRRWSIARAMVFLARLDEADVARAAMALVVPDAAQPSIPLGAIFGALSSDEANRLADIALAIPDGPLGIEYADGAVVITGDTSAMLAPLHNTTGE